MANRDNPADINETDLCYKYCAVNIEILIEDIEIISARSFVTLIDLALSFSHSMKCITIGEQGGFGFTEREEYISLRCAGDLAVATSSKRHWHATVEREELLEALRKFLQDAYSCLTSEIPELENNPVIRRLDQETST
ncbi:hypothetical protein [Sinosporangium album]|nr:hypothetical protein [Sinosporangium album]